MGETRQHDQDGVERDYCALALEYCHGVADGSIPACEWVRLACKRHLSDLEQAARGDFDYTWDREAASRPCAFMELLPHVEGRWSKATLELQPWQCFILTCVFGWLHRTTGVRRFRKALVVVPRKNGKTFMLAGIALYMLALDGESGAQVVSAATTRDQAKLSWSVAHKMVQRTPEMKEHLGLQALAHAIITDDGSSYKPLSRDADTLEGLSVSFGGIDELHAHKTREVFDVIDEATGARQQPILFIISTEGDNSEGVFAEQVKYLHNVLSGVHVDETYFGLYYSIDKEDDWTLEDSHRKANPNYGVSIFPADMEARCAQAKVNPASQASFLTKRLNVRVGAANAYFNMLAWRELCVVKDLVPSDLIGHPCIITIDMASKSDLTSKVMVFRAKQTTGRLRAGHYYVFSRSYIPEAVAAPGKPNYDMYRGWIAANAIEDTEGNVTDYERLEMDLLEDMRAYRPLAVGIDPNYNAAEFSNRMTRLGVPIQNVAHNVPTFTGPMKQLSALILAGKIHHGGNDPVLSWSLGNVTAKTDARGNVFPSKDHQDNKIDPAVATIAALSLWMREPGRISVYDDPAAAM